MPPPSPIHLLLRSSSSSREQPLHHRLTSALGRSSSLRALTRRPHQLQPPIKPPQSRWPSLTPVVVASPARLSRDKPSPTPPQPTLHRSTRAPSSEPEPSCHRSSAPNPPVSRCSCALFIPHATQSRTTPSQPKQPLKTLCPALDQP
ncbi:uncharacterized protein J3R85_012364 [Psidium guajava]|nr:uncharacterized protein J3R85_012364 [Psidium guajava]